MSLAHADGNRIYALFASAGLAAVHQIADATANPPVSTALVGVPNAFGGGQSFYDQCIAVDRPVVPAAQDLDGTADGAIDRLYIGGDTLWLVGPQESVASLWVVDVQAAHTVAAAPDISTTGVPPAGAGATQAGLVGDTVHPDVHVIRLVGSTRQPNGVGGL